MNKNYKKALINTLFDENILNSEDDRAEIKDIIDLYDGDFTGLWEDDLVRLKELWEKEHEKDDAEITAEEIEEVLSRMHVGHNVIPGLGVGYAATEDDLQNMKEFVRPILWMQVAFQKWFGETL